MRTKLDATDEMQVGTNPPPVDYFGEQNSTLQCMVGMSPIQAPGNGRGHVYSFCWEQTRHKIITTVQKHEIQLRPIQGSMTLRNFF